MNRKNKYEKMPRRLTGHAKKQLFSRLPPDTPITEFDRILDEILHQAELAGIKKEGQKTTYYFKLNGWRAVGKPKNGKMHILTIYSR